LFLILIKDNIDYFICFVMLRQLSQLIINKIPNDLLKIYHKISLNRQEAQMCLRILQTYPNTADAIEYLKQFNLDNTPVLNVLDLFANWCQKGNGFAGMVKDLKQTPDWFQIIFDLEFKDLTDIGKYYFYAAKKEPKHLIIKIDIDDPDVSVDDSYAYVERSLKSVFYEFATAPSQYIVETDDLVDETTVSTLPNVTVEESMVESYNFVNNVDKVENNDVEYKKYGIDLTPQLVDKVSEQLVKNRAIRELDPNKDKSSKPIVNMYPGDFGGAGGKFHRLFSVLRFEQNYIIEQWIQEPVLYNYGTGSKQNLSGYMLARFFQKSLIKNKDIIEPFKAVYSSNAEFVFKNIHDEREYKPGIYDIKLGSQAVNGKTYGNYKTNKDLLKYIACDHKTDCFCHTLVNYVIKEKKNVCLFVSFT